LKTAAAVGTAALTVAVTAVAVDKIVVQPKPPVISQTVIEEVHTAEAAAATLTAAAPGAATASPARSFNPSEPDDSLWARLDSRALAGLPPSFVLRPTHFSGESSGLVSTSSSGQGDQVLGRAITFKALLAVAYGVAPSRVLFADPMPADKLDVLMTGPDGSKTTLQEAIRRQFGLSAGRELREGDICVLKVKNPEAPGLKPSAQTEAAAAGGGGAGGGSVVTRQAVVKTIDHRVGGASSQSGPRGNEYSAQHQTIEDLVQNLQGHLETPLYDETGLIGSYDISLKWEAAGGQAAGESLKQALQEQLGLELTPARAQIEMLVVKKTE
jgi:uncharacterized protein (TIGR03435 family)